MRPQRRPLPSHAPPAGGGWRHVPALLLAALFVFPLWFMLVGSMQEAGGPPPTVPRLVPPFPPALENYPRAFELVALGRQALNSLLVVSLAVPLTVVFASWAGLAMSQLSRRARGAFIGASLVALMVPVTALLVSRFAVFRTLRLTDTFVPLVAPALIGTTPFYVLIFYWSFRRLPTELFEAARLEGLGALKTWRQIAMPLVRPVTVAVAVLAGVVTWGNFLDPLIYLFDPSNYTLPLGLRSLAQLDRQNFPLLLAGSVVATAPVVIAFLYVQRFFLQEHREAGWLGR